MKKCAVCPEEFIQFNSLVKVCSPKCALVLVQKEKEKKWAKEKTVYRKENKSLNKLTSEAQAAINKYVRLRDYFDPCIACGGSRAEIEAKQGWKTGGAWDAGHFKSRGAHKNLRFNLKNIHKQCKSCNGGSGKFSHKEKITSEKYEINLIEKIGADEVEKLKCDQEIRKYSREYLERIKTIFNKKARMQKKRLGI